MATCLRCLPCRQLSQSLRNLSNVGLPLPKTLADEQLFESWAEQKAWMTLQNDFNAAILDETLSPRDRKLRELFSGVHAGQWLTSPTPQFPSQRWSSGDWQSLLQWRLGLPLGLPENCVLCGAAQDAYGDHVLCCKSAGVYARHNTLRDTVADLLRECGCECPIEVPLPGTNLRPADVYTPNFPGDSETALDVSAVHPLHITHNATATVVAGAAAQKRETAKVALNEEKCSRRSWGYIAFVAETTGAWGHAAQRSVRAMVRAKSLRTGEDPQEVARAFWGALSRAVVSSVARQLVRAKGQSWAVERSAGPAASLPPGPSVHVQAPQGAGVAPPAGALNGCGPAGGDLLLARALCQ